MNVGSCSRGWCRVTWNKYGGYVRASALQFQSTPAGGPPAIPVYPPYPYKAGHYPTADAYYDLHRGHQPELLSLALFHDRPRAQPLSVHAARISWL